MKTRKALFGRRSKPRSEHPKKTQTSPSRSGDEEYSIETEKTPPQPTKNVQSTVKPRHVSKRSSFGRLSGQWASFSSDESDETTSSGMMKGLNMLRIQEVSITNSTPTPSPASIPRLAPPPFSSRGSGQSGASDVLQTWPNLPKGTELRSKSSTSQVSTEASNHKNVEVANETTAWVGFASLDHAEKKAVQDTNSRSMSVPAPSPKSETPVSPVMMNKDVGDSISDAAEDTKPSENTSMNETAPVGTSPSWEPFEDFAFAPTASVRNDDRPVNMETVKEGERHLDDTPFKSTRTPSKPPIMRSSYSAQKTGSSTRSNEAFPVELMKVPPRSPWIDSDEDAASLPTETTEDNPFASVALQKRYSSGCSLANKSGDAAFHAIITKHGAPQLELVETVNASFSGNKLTGYSVWGDVKFKLSGSAALSSDKDATELSSQAIDCLEVYHLVLRLKCVLNHVFLKHVIAKKSLMDWDDQAGIDRQSSLTMNEARKGLVESKVMHWSLARCYQEALSNPVTLLRYPVQPNTLSGPPLKIQIQWQRPKKDGQPVLVDISILPNRMLSTSLWGVMVCLKGFGKSSCGVEASACPEARWNPAECTFEWSIPIINPDDDVQHLRVKVKEKTVGSCPDYNLSASVKFVMPHATLSGTLLLGWIERKDANQSGPLFGADTTEGAQTCDFIFCEKMCLSGNYSADINY